MGRMNTAINGARDPPARLGTIVISTSVSEIIVRSDVARVLIVDDGPANVALLRRLLVRDGYSVATACDGVEAMQRMEEDLPDIVLTDLVMPRCDGLQLCRDIKGNPATRLIPVVLITLLRGREERLRGIDAGADDFLLKDLAAQVERLVANRRPGQQEP